MIRCVIFAALLTFVLCSYSPTRLQAQVVISEVYPAPDTGESEWIELYNTATSSADLSNWTLWDTLTTPSILQQFANFILNPKQVYVVTLSGSKLNNTGDTVILKDQSASISAQLAYPTGTKGLSWHLNLLQNTVFEASPSAGIVASASAVLPSPTPTATRAAEIVVPTASPSAQVQVKLSEIMACPKSGQEEWIELYNSGSNLQIDHWLVTDTLGNTRLLSGTINEASFAVFSWSSSMLNNTGDSLTITSNLGTLVDQATYNTCQSGYSLSFVADKWQLSEPTPNQANRLLQTAQVATASAQPAKQTTSQPPAESQIKTGLVLAATTKTLEPYPYSLKKISLSTPEPNMQRETVHSQIEQPKKTNSILDNGILGGLLIIISSLYAKKT